MSRHGTGYRQWGLSLIVPLAAVGPSNPKAPSLSQAQPHVSSVSGTGSCTRYSLLCLSPPRLCLFSESALARAVRLRYHLLEVFLDAPHGSQGPCKAGVQGSGFERWGVWLSFWAPGPSKGPGMEGPGRVSNSKLILCLSDHLSPSAPPSDPEPPLNCGPCMYHSLYLEPRPPDPHTARPSPTRASAPTPKLKETLATLSYLPEVSLLIYFPS